MRLTAVFESWHIGDGNYPPLTRGQLVRLSFEMQVVHAKPADAGTGTLEHVGNGEYVGAAVVIRDYSGLLVFEAGSFRFYSNSDVIQGLEVGQRVKLEGTLLFDHYGWVEFRHRYADPPDLFYTLRVSHIRQVRIPERFVSRHETGKSYPATVSPPDFGSIKEIETMEGQSFDEVFYLIDFDDADVCDRKIPLTFMG